MVIKHKTQEQSIKSEFESFLTRNKHRFKTDEQIELLRKAFKFAYKAHKNMVRYSGEPYINHPLEVAIIVSEKIGLGTTSAVAALLHDVPNKTEYDVEDIKQYFGEKIYSIVNSLLKIKKTEYFDNHAQASVLRQILLSVSDDIRVIFIKIADKLHNIRTVEHLAKEKRTKIVDDILSIYAPLSHRLGLYDIKSEMEDACLKNSNPYIYNQISEKLQNSERERVQFINRFIIPIKEKLDLHNFKYEIYGRSKSKYSVWKKMQTKGVPLEEIYDLFAVRVIFMPINKEIENFEALQIGTLITDIYKEKKERKRNWLKIGKDTGYRALHVTVMSDEGRWVEVQIRSEDMHEAAEHGLAAHWKYKGIKEKKSEFDNKVKEILDYLSEDNSTALTFIDNLKLNLFTSEIFVFTPKGDVISLPKGASVLDFAFKIHTDIAIKSIAGKVNGKSQSLNYTLKNGDQVEILTTKKDNIKKEWNDIVITQRAKYQLGKYFKQDIQKNIKAGKQILEFILKDIDSGNIENCIGKICRHLSLRKKEKLFEGIGDKTIAGKELKEAIRKHCYNEKKTKFWKIRMPFSGNDKEKNTNIQLPGSYKTAKCCNPIPGDEIIGVKDPKEKEVIHIHDKNCLTAQTEIAFGSVAVTTYWTSYKAISQLKEFKITGIDETGLINKITSIISKDLSVKIKSISFDTVKASFIAEIKLYAKQEDYSDILVKHLKKIPAIKNIEVIS